MSPGKQHPRPGSLGRGHRAERTLRWLRSHPQLCYLASSRLAISKNSNRVKAGDKRHGRDRDDSGTRSHRAGALAPPRSPWVGRRSKHVRGTWPIVSVDLCCLDRLNPGLEWLCRVTIFLSKRQELL